MLFTFLIKLSVVGAQVSIIDKSINSESNDSIKLLRLQAFIDSTVTDSIWLPYNEQMGDLAEHLYAQSGKKNSNARLHLAHYHHNLGYYYQNRGATEASLTNYYKSLSHYTNLNDDEGICNTLINIGTLYYDQQDYQQAIDFYSRSLKSSHLLEDTVTLSAVYNNLGAIYNATGYLHQAEDYLKKSIAMRVATNDEEGLGITYANLGGIYDKLNQNDSALWFYHKALQLQEKVNDEQGIALSQINFGSIYLKQHNYAKAEQLFASALHKAKTLHSPEVLLGAMNWLQKVYAQQKKYDKAYAIHLEYKEISDSIRNDNTRKKLINKQLQFEYDIKERELKLEQERKQLLAESEIEKQKLIRNWIMGATLFLILSGLALFIFYKRRKEAIIMQQLTDLNLRAINAQMNPHFIFNCMQSIQSFVAKKDFAQADSSLLQFAKLIRSALDRSMQPMVTLRDELTTLNDYVSLESIRLDYPLALHVTLDNELEPELIQIPPLLLQPILENAILHGIKPAQRAGVINLKIAIDKQKILFQISDNGIGIQPKEKEVSRKSYGIELTKERLLLLNKSKGMPYEFTIQNIVSNHHVQGACVTLSIPFTNLAA